MIKLSGWDYERGIDRKWCILVSGGAYPVAPAISAALDEIERLETENRVLWKCVRNRATEQQSLEAVKRGDYVTSEELLSETRARNL